ncbi:MAG: MltA domain-containing protein [Pseudomonadota bacterium]
MRIRTLLGAALLILCGCETQPPMAPAPRSIPAPDPSPYWADPPKPTAFEALPGWQAASLAPGLNALRRSCEVFSARDPNVYLSPRAPWAGRASDWQPVCAALDVIRDEASARAVFQALFAPVEIEDRAGDGKFTGYFEPSFPARLSPVPPYTEPIPALPSDLVNRGGEVFQRLANGALRPYPARAEITSAGVKPLAYAHPADVFFLQIQGSGRLLLPDGRTLRAAYAAHNGQPFRSTANWLMERGWITPGEASMKGIRAWMDRVPAAQSREAMNANPRFVFFSLLPEGDPMLGPKGSLGVPLTPLGSMAIDLNFHAAGVPMFVQTTAPGLGGLWSSLVVAQDTGGAIKGPVRGDLYFGTGQAAGSAADTVNAPGRLWVLLPRALADRLRAEASIREFRLTAIVP